MNRPLAVVGGLLASAALATMGGTRHGLAAEAGSIVLVPHTAVYDLKVARSSENHRIEAARGRILYEFSGNVCEGYALQFRQVSELDSGEGKLALSDLRTTTWEDGAAKRFRFKSENYLNRQQVGSVDGEAERTADGIAVKLKEPDEKKFTLDGSLGFPSQHMLKIIAAARAGQTVLEYPIYDGSETGEKTFNTLSVIGRGIGPNDKRPDDATAGNPAFANLKRWPVTLSYFERTAPNGGEQTPAYSIGFEVFENGVSRALLLDYGDFALAGELSKVEVKTPKPCP